MNFVVSLIFRERIFHLSFPPGERIEISDSESADMFLPELGHKVTLNAGKGIIQVSDIKENGEESRFTMRPDYPHMLDRARRIALCISEESLCPGTAVLGASFAISTGRKKERKDGGKNDIVISSRPFISGMQFELVRINGKTMLTDMHSTNGTFVNGRRVQTAELHRGDEISVLTAQIIYEEDYLQFKNIGDGLWLDEELRVRPVPPKQEREFFKRSPRIQEGLPSGKIEIPGPPAAASKPEINWLSTLLPAAVTIAIALTMALAFKNTMMMLYSLPMTLAGVLVSVLNYFRGYKLYLRKLKERREAYLESLKDTEADINEKREAQKRALLSADPSPEDCYAIVKRRSTRLWCRKPGDGDFGSVRLGTGTVPFSVALNYPREHMQEEDELRKKPGELFRASEKIEDMPILCNIRKVGIVGLLGEPECTHAQLQNMLLQLSTHHCCTELKLVCIYSEDERRELSWLEKLPHCHGFSQEELYLAGTQEEADGLFRSFTEVFRKRRQEASENKGSSFMPYILFVIFEPEMLKKEDPINRFLFMERGLGAGCLVAAREISQLPKQCTEIIELSQSEGELYSTMQASQRQSFIPDWIQPDFRMMFAQSMSPLYCDESIAVSSLPRSCSFYELLGISSMADYDIGKHWAASDLLTSKLAPSAAIGVQENGEQIFFSSPPTGDNGGAHALVAGATGSGKSETLLTLILSLALKYPPEEAGFLIIDFKGDSIASKLSGLPHLRGIITSLDDSELRRSLISIGAENKKRMQMFKEYNESHPREKNKISDIRDYNEKYRQGRVKEPLPHLFIVVDEFAEMKKQLPDIMDQFLSAAQTGRSLGIHLILATQSPSGVIDNKIRANIFKQLCLKVANTGESRDVIGSELAAGIKVPGRAYLKVDDSLQLFQSAYGGGRLCLADGSESTQLQEAVEAVSAYCRAQNIPKLPDIFCPPLPECSVFPRRSWENIAGQDYGMLPVGIRDDPAEQFSGLYCMDIFSRNTLIVGSQLMGKTNLLQTILRGAAELYGPEELNVYILEFSSLFLKNFEALPQVGGVVTLQDTEKICNLFQMLGREKEERRRKFMELGVSNFSSYRESGRRDLPRILLLVDGLAAAKNYFPPDNDPLLGICREGLTLGISVAATASQPLGGMSYMPAFANRIALYNNDVNAYATLMGRSPLRPEELPGRCLVAFEGGVYACQSFLAFEGRREIDRAGQIRSFCREQRERAKGLQAKPIPFIPRDITAAAAFEAYPQAYADGRFMLGLDYATVEPLSVRLGALGMLALSGRERDVRNFHRYLLAAAEKSDSRNTVFYIADSLERSLEPLSGLSCVAEYSFLPDRAVDMLRRMRDEAEARYNRLMQEGVSFLDSLPTLVLMLNCSEAINSIASDKAALYDWGLLTGRYRAMNVCVIFGQLDNVSIPYSSELLKKMRESRRLIFFDNLGNLKIGELPYSTVKKFPAELPEGDAYLILENETARIRVPDCPEI